jgi:carbonic anhydrase
MGPRHQSPVDIPAAAPRHDGIEISYQPTTLVLGTNAYAVQVDCAPGSTAIIAGTRYELAQFHFHCPGEHTFDGQRADGELHLVHRSAVGQVAVLGVQLSVGRRCASLDTLVASLAEGTPDRIDPSALVPADLEYVAYEGSLTTPPYDEGVAWHVLTQPIEFSSSQLDTIGAVHGRNSRPVQPWAGRTFG